MPTFKRFNGFQIDVRSRDHNPPHFHLVDPDHECLVDLRTLQVMCGSYSRKVLAAAIAWVSEGDNIDDLLKEWSRLNERD